MKFSQKIYYSMIKSYIFCMVKIFQLILAKLRIMINYFIKKYSLQKI